MTLGMPVDRQFAVLGPLQSGVSTRAFLGVEVVDDIPAPDRPVVVVWMPNDVVADERQLARLQRETAFITQVKHANLIDVHGLVHFEEGWARVVEYVDGEPLARVLREARAEAYPITGELAARIIVDICLGLSHAHEEGVNRFNGRPIVHAGIRPDTILVGFDGTIRVTGYGASVLAPTNNGALPPEIYFYLAPEQVLGGRATGNPATDVYAVGTVLFELLSGYPPFAGADDPEQAVMAEPPPVIGDEGLVKRLGDVAARAMSKRGLDRFESIEAMKDAILDALQEEGAVLPASAAVAELINVVIPVDAPERIGRRELLASALDPETVTPLTRREAAEAAAAAAAAAAETTVVESASSAPEAATDEATAARPEPTRVDGPAPAGPSLASFAVGSPGPGTDAPKAAGLGSAAVPDALSDEAVTQGRVELDALRASGDPGDRAPTVPDGPRSDVGPPAATGGLPPSAITDELPIAAVAMGAPSMVPNPVSSIPSSAGPVSHPAAQALPYGAATAPTGSLPPGFPTSVPSSQPYVPLGRPAPQPPRVAPRSNPGQPPLSDPRLENAPVSGLPPAPPKSSSPIRESSASITFFNRRAGDASRSVFLLVVLVAVALLGFIFAFPKEPPAGLNDPVRTRLPPELIKEAISARGATAVADPSEPIAPDSEPSPPVGTPAVVPSPDITTAEKTAAAGAPAEALQPEKVAAPVAPGRLSISSDPVVSVFVGDKALGRTPVTTELPPGRHRVRLTDGETGINTYRTIRVRSGERTQKAYEFGTCQLVVEAPEGAVVKLNARVLGTAPIEEQTIYEGSYLLRVSYLGAVWSERLAARAGERLTYTVRLKDAPR